MKKLNKIITALLISLLLVTVSCTNNFNSVNDNTDKNNGTESVETKKYGTLIFSESLARAVLPEITMGDFNCIQLLGLYNGNEEELANVSSLEELNKQNILVETGNWIFTLNCFRLNNRDDLSTAYITFSDTVSVEIIEGTNTISFEVERKEFKYDSGEGYFTFILDFDPEQNVREVIYSILDPTTMHPITVDDKEYKDISTSVSNSKKSISANPIPSGEYIFSAKILNADGVIITYFSDLIVIIDEIHSRGEGVIENYNDTYKITYNYDFGELSSAAVKNFSRFNETISLENTLNLKYGKFEGWYTTEDFSGEPVTQIEPTENLNDISLYAKLSKEIECKVSELDTAVAYVKGGNLTAIIKNEDFSSTALWNNLNKCNCSMTLDVSNLELTELGKAFVQGLNCLEKVILPDSITVINDNAFANCKNLKEVNLPKNLTKLGNYSFRYSNKIENIELPDSLEEIGNSAFGECESLTEITIPENVTKIGSFAFSAMKNLQTINWNAIDCNEGVSKNTSIFAGVTDDARKITVNIGNKVEKIPDYLFYNIKVVETELPESIKEIGNYAFFGNELKEIIIPLNCEAIGKNAFCGNGDLKSIIYKSKNCNFLYATLDDSPFLPLIQKEGKCSVVIDDTVEIIPSLFLKNMTDIESIQLPDSVLEIGQEAFAGLTKITEINIPKNVVKIGKKAFHYCSNVQNIYFDAINCKDENSDAPNFIFNGNKDVYVEIGNSVKYIPECLFYSNSDLKSVKIIGSEEGCNIGKQSFYSCSNFESLEIGENVKSIGNSAFMGCKKLQKVNFNAVECEDLSSNSEVFKLYNEQETLLTVEFGDSVKRIPDNLLYGNINLDTVIIGQNVEYIGRDAFKNCNNITLFEYNTKKWTKFENFSPFSGFKNSNSDVGLKIKFGEDFVLPDNVFYGNEYITDIEFKSGTKKIPANAFANCEKLKNVTFADDSVTEIGKKAFYKSGIEKIVLPDSLKIINDHAFYNCSLLSEVTFGNSLEVIKTVAFYLTKVEHYSLPASLKYIGSQAFGEFSRNDEDIVLKSVTFEDPTDWEIVSSLGNKPVDFSNPTENVRYLNASGNKYIKHGFEYSE